MTGERDHPGLDLRELGYDYLDDMLELGMSEAEQITRSEGSASDGGMPTLDELI